MQIAESFHTASALHLLTDEIYSPSLKTIPSVADVLAAQATLNAQQHTKVITELHRFLESSCDCV